jgi:hypothetical protein
MTALTADRNTLSRDGSLYDYPVAASVTCYAGGIAVLDASGNDCYLVDDQTVAKTSATNTRSVAGKIVDVDSQGVWVKLGI